jgi:hypothetical protein
MVNLFPEDPLLLIVAANTHRPIWLSEVKSALYGVYLITSKVLDARRRGATTEPYEAIWCKPVESLQVEREVRSKATGPFDFAQGREPVERQMMP